MIKLTLIDPIPFSPLVIPQKNTPTHISVFGMEYPNIGTIVGIYHHFVFYQFRQTPIIYNTKTNYREDIPYEGVLEIDGDVIRIKNRFITSYFIIDD
jgi:hypothetical protein